MNDNWQRLFAYITGAIVIGLILLLATHHFLAYVNDPGWRGYLALFGYGLIYLNFAYIINRRYTQKIESPSNTSYLMSVLLVIPILFWIYSKDTGLQESLLVFTLTILFAGFLGTYYGVRSGVRRRKAYLQKKEFENDSGRDEEPARRS